MEDHCDLGLCPVVEDMVAGQTVASTSKHALGCGPFFFFARSHHHHDSPPLRPTMCSSNAQVPLMEEWTASVQERRHHDGKGSTITGLMKVEHILHFMEDVPGWS